MCLSGNMKSGAVKSDWSNFREQLNCFSCTYILYTFNEMKRKCILN